MPQSSSSYPRLSPSAQQALLDGILARCAPTPGSSTPPVVVFDLDGTIMDNRPRTCSILRDLAERWSEAAPEAAKRLRGAQPHQLEYLLTETLEGLGVHQTDLVADAEVYWRSRFFGDEDLRHDVEVPGAVLFAKACYEAGATLVYLTGRDLPLMGIGTFKSLRDLGFPIGVSGTELVLKPDAAMPDEAFKRMAAPTMARVGRVVASFDNEPANSNVFAEAYPECESVLVDTQHLPGAPPLLPRVHTIGNFKRD